MDFTLLSSRSIGAGMSARRSLCLARSRPRLDHPQRAQRIGAGTHLAGRFPQAEILDFAGTKQALDGLFGAGMLGLRLDHDPQERNFPAPLVTLNNYASASTELTGCSSIFLTLRQRGLSIRNAAQELKESRRRWLRALAAMPGPIGNPAPASPPTRPGRAMAMGFEIARTIRALSESRESQKLDLAAVDYYDPRIGTCCECRADQPAATSASGRRKSSYGSLPQSRRLDLFPGSGPQRTACFAGGRKWNGQRTPEWPAGAPHRVVGAALATCAPRSKPCAPPNASGSGHGLSPLDHRRQLRMGQLRTPAFGIHGVLHPGSKSPRSSISICREMTRQSAFRSLGAQNPSP